MLPTLFVDPDAILLRHGRLPHPVSESFDSYSYWGIAKSWSQLISTINYQKFQTLVISVYTYQFDPHPFYSLGGHLYLKFTLENQRESNFLTSLNAFNTTDETRCQSQRWWLIELLLSLLCLPVIKLDIIIQSISVELVGTFPTITLQGRKIAGENAKEMMDDVSSSPIKNILKGSLEKYPSANYFSLHFIGPTLLVYVLNKF